LSPEIEEIASFLRARWGEDEQAARASDPGPWEVGPSFGAKDSRVYVREEGDLIDSVGTCVIAGQVANKTRSCENAIHIARQDPARTLRRIEANLDVLERYEANTVPEWPLFPLYAMTREYSDHQDYKPKWGE
jgi:hypothetical protein